MTTKFIHSDFEIDISDLPLQWSEENPWFSDTFFLPYTFPVEMDISDHKELEPLRYYNSQATTYYEGKLLINNRISNAEMKVEQIVGSKIKVSFRSGIDNFPNWDKNLREIDFGVVEGEMISAASAVINKTYPEVKYNFPMVHTDYYDGARSMQDFEGTLNKRVGASFVQNIADIPNNTYQNKNIVYPFVYIQHVLSTIIADAGHELTGDVLNDTDLKDVLLLPAGTIEITDRPETTDWLVGMESYVEQSEYGPYGSYGWYRSEQPINIRGKFRIKGTGKCGQNAFRRFESSLGPKLYFNNNLVFSVNRKGDYNIDFTIDTVEGSDNILRFQSFDHEDYQENRLEVKIIPLEIYDENGELIPALANYSNVNLADKLPNITVGDFIKFYKNLKNYDFTKKPDQSVSMNLITDQMSRADAIDLRAYENDNLIRKYNDAESFILQFAEVNKEGVAYEKVYFDRNGASNQGYTQQENTKVITINGWPLPQMEKNGINTAMQITDDETKIQLLRYSGLKFSKNVTESMEDMHIPELVDKYWKSWFYFRINTQTFEDVITDSKTITQLLTPKSIIFMYNNYFIIRTLDRTTLNKRWEQIRIEMDKMI